MKYVDFWFDNSFIELLSIEHKSGVFGYSFNGEPSIKHLVEALRIPHTEIGRIMVNGCEVGLSYLPQDQDKIEIYPLDGDRPYFRPVVNSSYHDARFILDNHLGKLTTYLRILGFDALYRNDFQDDELSEIASREGRVLLTRDRGLLMRRAIIYGYFIRSMDAREQVIEVLRQYSLEGQVRPFSRCLRCNGQLQRVDKVSILDRLEPLTQKYYNEFCICLDCDQIYWKGSHYERMQEFIRPLKGKDEEQ
jgi:uncharacterized protein